MGLAIFYVTPTIFLYPDKFDQLFACINSAGIHGTKEKTRS